MPLLLDLLHDCVRRFSAAPALVWRGTTWSYDDLDKAQRAVAEYLAHRKVQPGDRIALLFRNCPHYVALYYGILTAGCVVVPLNSHERASLLARQVKHSGTSIVIGESTHPEWDALRSALSDAVLAIGIPIAGDDSAAEAFATRMRSLGTASAPPRTCAEHSLASIVYTSGTTGQPKGVMLSHGNLAANMLAIVSYLELTERDSVLAVLPFPFSYGNSVLHTHLIAGARVVIEDHVAYPRVILERMQNERVTGFSGVPSTFAVLLARLRFDAFDLSSLRYVTQAGDAMPGPLLHKLREQLPRAQLFTMYGQTEATSRLTYLPPRLLESKFGSVGVGIPGVDIRISGADGRALAAGETGEICASGPNVMLGYWQDPTLTASVLRDGWLHTGDLGHKDADGYLFIDGRMRDMIKVGAFRVSPQEVEEVLTEIPGIQEAAVTPVTDALLGQAVKAVIVPADGESLDVQTVRAHCRARLALYKVPRDIGFVTSLPRTPSGKVQRFKLT